MLLAILLGSGPAYSASSLPAPALLSGEDYSETYSLTAYGAEGIVQLQFGITNLGWGSARAICRLYVQHAGARIRKHEMYKRKEWKSFGDPVTALTAPGCRVDANENSLRFEADIDGTLVRVEMTKPVFIVKTPQTQTESKSGLYRSQVLLPAAPAVIIWGSDGKLSRFSGHAHVDHSLSTLLPRKIAAGWLRFRALGDDRPLILSVRLAPAASTFVGWEYRNQKVTPLQLSKPSWWPNSSTGVEVPSPLGILRIGKQIEVFEPLRDLGALRHAAELLVGHPQTVLYWAELGGKTGVLEVATQD